MRNPTLAARRTMRWELSRIRTTIERLRRWERRLAELGGQDNSFAAAARALAAALACNLADSLAPSAEALEKAVLSTEPLPETDEEP